MKIIREKILKVLMNKECQNNCVSFFKRENLLASQGNSRPPVSSSWSDNSSLPPALSPPFFLYKHVYGVPTLRQAGTVLEDKGISKTFTSPAFLVTWEDCRLLEPSILKLPARWFWTLSDPRRSSDPRESQPVRTAASVHTEHFSLNETTNGGKK